MKMDNGIGVNEFGVIEYDKREELEGFYFLFEDMEESRRWKFYSECAGWRDNYFRDIINWVNDDGISVWKWDEKRDMDRMRKIVKYCVGNRESRMIIERELKGLL